MSTEYSAHIQPFTWTRPHLRGLCSDIQSALEKWATGDGDEVESDQTLAPAREAARQMQSTLALLGTRGGASLAEALVDVIEALQEGSAKEPEESINLALEAVAILPDYLDRLETGEPDAPVILLPLINDLRASAGQSLLSEDSFFDPDLDLVEPPEAETESIDPKMLRRRYEIALLNWLKAEEDPGEALDGISQVLSRLQRSGLDGPEVRRMAWTGQAVMAGLKSGNIADGAGLRRIFARLDVLLRSLVRQSEESGSEPGVTEQADLITRGMLFHVALAEPGCEPVDQLVEQAALRNLLPERLELEKARSALSGRNRGVFASVAGAVQEELSQIKEQLDLHLRGDETAPDHIQGLTGMLTSMGETLSMLGLNRLAERVASQAGRLDNLSGNPDDPELLDVAHQLLLVENELDESIRFMGESAEIEAAVGSSLLPENERRRVLRQLIGEALEDLQQAKHLLDSIHKNETDPESAGQVTRLLTRITGALQLGGLDEAADLTAGNEQFIRNEILEAEKLPSRDRMEALAESLTDLEFYIESLPRMDDSGRRFLEHARKRLAQLGYPSDPAKALGPESEPVDDTLQAVPDEPVIVPEQESESLDPATDEPEVVGSYDDSEALQEAAEELEAATDEAASDPAGEDTWPGEEETDDEDEEFDVREIFLEELELERDALHASIERLESNPHDHEALSNIRRSFHTIKGSGRMVGETRIGEFAWMVENLLNRALDGHLEAASIINLIRDCVDAVDGLDNEIRGKEPGLDNEVLEALVERIGNAADGKLEVLDDSDMTGEEPDDGELPDESPDDLDPTLVQLMVNELSENLDVLEAYISDAQERGWPSPATSDLVRSVHTMKGTLRLAPLGSEGEAAQELEHYFNELAEHSEPPEPEGMKCTRRMAGLFRARLERLKGEEIDESQFQCDDLTASFRDLLRQLREKDRGLSDTPGQIPVEGEDLTDEDSIFHMAGDPYADSRDTSEDPPSEPADYVFNIDDDEPEEPEPVSDEFPDETEELQPDEPETSDESGYLEPALDGPDDSSDVPVEAGGEDRQDVESWDSLDLEEDWDRSEELEELKAAAESSPASEADGESGDIPAQDAEPEELEAHLEVPEESGERDLEPLEDQPEVPAQPTELADDAFGIDYDQVDSELVEIFLEEGNELLERSDELIQEWRQDLSSPAVVTGLQRNLHTIKGSARMAGFNQVGEVAHVMEELLEAIAGGQTRATDEAVGAIELGCDHLHKMLGAIADRKPIPVMPLSELTAEADMELTAPVAQPVEDDAMPAPQRGVEERQTETRRDTLRVDADLVDDLVNYAGEISIFRSRLEQQVSVFRTNVTEVDSTVNRLRDQLRKLELETEAQILARFEREHGVLDETFDPLELDRYSNIQQLSRALAESVTDLTSLTQILDDATRQSETLLMQQSRVNTELQEGLMQARLVSFSTLEPRFRRVVRNACRDTGKQASLDIRHLGESELDRNILERISAPLEHMLRNAVAHGIEAPANRRQSGKPEAGTVTVEVDRESTEMVIRVIDDGAGLDEERIRQAAIEKGLLRPDSKVSEDELYQYILESGFSTADEVSELAGRGVGMDVVANEIRQVGGNIRLHSEPGKGARFSIRIPLTLAVMQAIMVRAADRTFAIPLQAVRGVARMMTSDYERAMSEPNPEYEYAGETYPLMELEPRLGLETPPPTGATINLLMIQSGEERAAFRVTELLGHRETVIKPVGPQISSIPGILSGTITGDGQVVLILDMAPLIRHGLARMQDTLDEDAIEQTPVSVPEAKRTPLVLIVDDSITMRRITSRVLENRELEVLTAKDGLDAIEVMYDRVPDVMLLDIEMPRMDGYELTTHVRNDPRLKAIPIMMITSRTGEKHRQHALDLGVNRYISKPYQETELIRNVFEMLELPVPEV